MEDEFKRLRMFLEAHFGDVSIPRTEVPEGEEDDLLVMDVTVDGIVARIDLISMVSPASHLVSGYLFEGELTTL